MDKQIYIECARAMLNRLRSEINGGIKYEIYPEVDTIIIKINFKNFDFNYGINNVQELMMNDGIHLAIDDLLYKYKKAVLNGFFKTEERKEREKLEGMFV